MATHPAPGGGPPFSGPPLSRPPAGFPQDLPTVGRHPVESPLLSSPPLSSPRCARAAAAADPAPPTPSPPAPASGRPGDPTRSPTRARTPAVWPSATTRQQEPAPFNAFSSTTNPSFSDQSYAETPRPGFVDTTRDRHRADRLQPGTLVRRVPDPSPRRRRRPYRTRPARSRNTAARTSRLPPPRRCRRRPSRNRRRPGPAAASSAVAGSRSAAARPEPTRTPRFGAIPARDTRLRTRRLETCQFGTRRPEHSCRGHCRPAAVPEPAHRPEVPPQNAPTWPGRNPLPHEAAQQSPPPEDMPPRDCRHGQQTTCRPGTIPRQGYTTQGYTTPGCRQAPATAPARGTMPPRDLPDLPPAAANSPLPDGPIRQPPPRRPRPPGPRAARRLARPCRTPTPSPHRCPSRPLPSRISVAARVASARTTTNMSTG